MQKIEVRINKIPNEFEKFLIHLETQGIYVEDLIKKYKDGNTEKIFFRKEEYNEAITALLCKRKNNTLTN